jgi:hypothetical protein
VIRRYGKKMAESDRSRHLKELGRYTGIDHVRDPNEAEHEDNLETEIGLRKETNGRRKNARMVPWGEYPVDTPQEVIPQETEPAVVLDGDAEESRGRSEQIEAPLPRRDYPINSRLRLKTKASVENYLIFDTDVRNGSLELPTKDSSSKGGGPDS